MSHTSTLETIKTTIEQVVAGVNAVGSTRNGIWARTPRYARAVTFGDDWAVAQDWTGESYYSAGTWPTTGTIGSVSGLSVNADKLAGEHIYDETQNLARRILSNGATDASGDTELRVMDMDTAPSNGTDGAIHDGFVLLEEVKPLEAHPEDRRFQVRLDSIDSVQAYGDGLGRWAADLAILVAYQHDSEPVRTEFRAAEDSRAIVAALTRRAGMPSEATFLAAGPPTEVAGGIDEDYVIVATPLTAMWREQQGEN